MIDQQLRGQVVLLDIIKYHSEQQHNSAVQTNVNRTSDI